MVNAAIVFLKDGLDQKEVRRWIIERCRSWHDSGQDHY